MRKNIVKKLFGYNSLEDWTTVVPAAVEDFYTEFNVYPTFLIANSSVFTSLLKNCINEGIENYNPGVDAEPLKLGGYISSHFALQYVDDDTLEEFHFLLVHKIKRSK
jgi:hypothetical protein